jgi:DNA polymerase-1
MRVLPSQNQIALIDDLPEHKIAAKTGNVVVSKTGLRGLRERDAKLVLNPNYVLVQTDEHLAACVAAIEASDQIAIDTEHRSKNKWWCKKAVGLSIYTPSDRKAYFVPNRMQHAMRNFTDDEIQAAFEDTFYSEDILKIGQNFKGDIHFLRETYNLFVRGVYHDTLLAGIVLNENEPHDLEALSVRYLKAPPWKISFDAAPETWPIKTAAQYACKDAEMTYKLAQFQRMHFDKQQHAKLSAIMYNMEMPVASRIVVDMERRGFGWDADYHANVMKPTIEAEKASAAQRVLEQTGPINLESNEQLAVAFFETLNIPRIRDNHLDKPVLEELGRQGYTVATDMLDYRKFATIDKMFVRTLPDFVYNGRIHCNINTIGAETGRMSANDPNLMQIPKRIGPIIRRGFIPSPGKVLISLDFSQIELRVLADRSGDPTLIAAFVAGQDAHTAVMCSMLHVDYADYEAHPDLPKYIQARVKAKAVNFGVLYGQGAAALAASLGIPLEEAIAFKAAYFKRMPMVKHFIDATHLFAYNNGYVETCMGRKRRLPNIRSQDRMLSSAAEREAVNSIHQGSVADFAKQTMIDHDNLIKGQHWPYELLLQIHDELIYEVPRDWLAHNRKTLDDGLVATMQNVYKLKVPIVANYDILERWGDKIYIDDEGEAA